LRRGKGRDMQLTAGLREKRAGLDGAILIYAEDYEFTIKELKIIGRNEPKAARKRGQKVIEGIRKAQKENQPFIYVGWQM